VYNQIHQTFREEIFLQILLFILLSLFYYAFLWLSLRSASFIFPILLTGFYWNIFFVIILEINFVILLFSIGHSFLLKDLLLNDRTKGGGYKFAMMSGAHLRAVTSHDYLQRTVMRIVNIPQALSSLTLDDEVTRTVQFAHARWQCAAVGKYCPREWHMGEIKSETARWIYIHGIKIVSVEN